MINEENERMPPPGDDQPDYLREWSLRAGAEFEGETVTWMRALNLTYYENRDLLMSAAQVLRYAARVVTLLTDGMFSVHIQFHPSSHAADIIVSAAEACGGDLPEVVPGDEWKEEDPLAQLLTEEAYRALAFCREFREDQDFDAPAVVFHYMTDNWRNPEDCLSLEGFRDWVKSTSTDHSFNRTLRYAGLGQWARRDPDEEKPK